MSPATAAAATATTSMARMSSTTAAPITIRPARFSSIPALRSAREVTPTLVAVNAAPTNSATDSG